MAGLTNKYPVHPISTPETMTEILKKAFPGSITQVCQTLNKAGFEAFIVGGALRDAVLGKPLSDVDMASNATPYEIHTLFPDAIPTGKAFGTLTILLSNSDTIGKIEITTYRSEGTYSNQRHPDTLKFEKHISKDLSRRDFTINSMAYDPIANLFIDEYSGLADLNHKMIRTVGDPKLRFKEDSLRLFRACRLTAQLGFQCEKETELALKTESKDALLPAKERIFWELKKIFTSKHPSFALKNLKQSGLGERILKGFNSIPENNFIKIDSLPLHHRWAYFLKDHHCKKTFDTLCLPKKEQKKILQLIRFNFDDKKAAFKVSDLALTGKTLKELGYTGVQIGKIQAHLYNQIIDDLSKNNEEFCYKKLKEWEMNQAANEW